MMGLLEECASADIAAVVSQMLLARRTEMVDLPRSTARSNLLSSSLHDGHCFGKCAKLQSHGMRVGSVKIHQKVQDF